MCLCLSERLFFFRQAPRLHNLLYVRQGLCIVGLTRSPHAQCLPVVVPSAGWSGVLACSHRVCVCVCVLRVLVSGPGLAAVCAAGSEDCSGKYPKCAPTVRIVLYCILLQESVCARQTERRLGLRSSGGVSPAAVLCSVLISWFSTCVCVCLALVPRLSEARTNPILSLARAVAVTPLPCSPALTLSLSTDSGSKH